MHTPLPWRRGVLIGLLAATTLNACTSWRVQPVTPEQLISDRPVKEVRIARPDSSWLVLSGPHLVVDSLVGMTRRKRIAIPLTDIRHIAVRQGNALKTTGLVLGIFLGIPFALFGVVCLVSAASGENCNASGS